MEQLISSLNWEFPEFSFIVVKSIDKLMVVNIIFTTQSIGSMCWNESTDQMHVAETNKTTAHI